MKVRIHRESDCVGPCPFHAPSDHHMKDWPITLRETGLVERKCQHGVGHPDPDSVAWFEKHGITHMGVHGCDGCCTPPKEKTV